jgi:ubiquinone/menaquinone biosynthesis C-methylase UbiE
MLGEGRKFLKAEQIENQVPQVCASALEMPFKSNVYDIAICCLATHHMDVELLLSNIMHTLKPGGKVYLADAGAASTWKNAFVKLLLKGLAFFYFLFQENISRARAEASAIGNIHSSREWQKLISSAGFTNINLIKMKSGRFWAPDPIMIRAQKP